MGEGVSSPAQERLTRVNEAPVGADCERRLFSWIKSDAAPRFARSRLFGPRHGVFHWSGPGRGERRRHERRRSVVVRTRIACANSAIRRVLGGERPGRPRLLSVRRRFWRGRPCHRPGSSAASSAWRRRSASPCGESQLLRRVFRACGRRRRIPVRRSSLRRCDGHTRVCRQRRFSWAWRGGKFPWRRCRSSPHRRACFPGRDWWRWRFPCRRRGRSAPHRSAGLVGRWRGVSCPRRSACLQRTCRRRSLKRPPALVDRQ